MNYYSNSASAFPRESHSASSYYGHHESPQSYASYQGQSHYGSYQQYPQQSYGNFHHSNSPPGGHASSYYNAAPTPFYQGPKGSFASHTDTPAATGERGLGGAVTGGLLGMWAGRKTGHGFLGTVGGAIAGSLAQDKLNDKKKSDKQKKKDKKQHHQSHRKRGDISSDSS